MNLDRRTLLTGTAVLGFAGAFGLWPAKADISRVGAYKLTDAEWRKKLSPLAYNVLRHAATERAGTSPLLEEHRKGTFTCAGCDLKLFDSSTKYDSHTGWPSFWKPLPQAIGTSTDEELGYQRTEVHCRRCLGHLGHVFDDGPKPTGLRYCMNGVSLKFIPA
jgi:peptide-methionine (R)-S-oxide reductase